MILEGLTLVPSALVGWQFCQIVTEKDLKVHYFNLLKKARESVHHVRVDAVAHCNKLNDFCSKRGY